MSNLPVISYRVILSYYPNKNPVFQSGYSVSNIHKKRETNKKKFPPLPQNLKASHIDVKIFLKYLWETLQKMVQTWRWEM